MDLIEDMTNGLLFEKALYLCARQIHSYCRSVGWCGDCVFNNAEKHECRLKNPPQWDLPDRMAMTQNNEVTEKYKACTNCKNYMMPCCDACDPPFSDYWEAREDDN